ncbi:MAG TPA: M20/M25/M40 family metallo-hydrolase [Candidatus Polarisedimenticolaceae bacterium]|nr:M20/M25/M40 family metallo-hydrolase [Candidatus Polarisedimenticolaceae bacterium]
MSLVVLAAAGPVVASEGPDLEVVHRIKQEAFKRSRVMETLHQMTDVHGPRLTNSPGMDRAARWAAEQAAAWGLEQVAVESWGPFGRGWSASRFAAHLVDPQYAPLIGVPLPWAPGTGGPIRGTPLFAPLQDKTDHEDRVAELERYVEQWSGKLRGRMVLLGEPPHIEPETDAPSERYSSSELSDRAEASDPVEPIEIDPTNVVLPDNPYERERFRAHAPAWARAVLREQRRELRNRLNEFLVAEGVALVIRPARDGDAGTVFPSGAGSHRLDDPLPPPSISLTPEHYNRIARLARNGGPVTIEVEVDARMHTDDLDGANVVAEIPGGSRADELVIIGAHYDDWAYATGSTDNAAGCAVMMEAMRILAALDLPLARTARMVLWTGEEQGLLGSKAYVRRHFGDPRTMELEPAHAKVSAYFNLDNGTGKIRGVYLQGNDMVRPIFKAWLAPFGDHGASTVTIRDTGGTDHLSFDAVGIPGFQFIQDPVEYWSRTHHSNMDVYDRAVPADLMQAAAIVATFVYQTANHDALLPRKPLPEPWPENLRHLDD